MPTYAVSYCADHAGKEVDYTVTDFWQRNLEAGLSYKNWIRPTVTKIGTRMTQIERIVTDKNYDRPLLQ